MEEFLKGELHWQVIKNYYNNCPPNIDLSSLTEWFLEKIAYQSEITELPFELLEFKPSDDFVRKVRYELIDKQITNERSFYIFFSCYLKFKLFRTDNFLSKIEKICIKNENLLTSFFKASIQFFPDWIIPKIISNAILSEISGRNNFYMRWNFFDTPSQLSESTLNALKSYIFHLECNQQVSKKISSIGSKSNSYYVLNDLAFNMLSEEINKSDAIKYGNTVCSLHKGDKKDIVRFIKNKLSSEFTDLTLTSDKLREFNYMFVNETVAKLKKMKLSEIDKSEMVFDVNKLDQYILKSCEPYKISASIFSYVTFLIEDINSKNFKGISII